MAVPTDTGRARTHIKAIADTIKDWTKPDEPELIQIFASGMLTGLAASVQIMDGASAEKALEDLAHGMEAMIGRMFLEGKLSQPQTPAAPNLGKEQH